MDLTREDTRVITEALHGMIQYKRSIAGLMSADNREDTQKWVLSAQAVLHKLLTEN